MNFKTLLTKLHSAMGEGESMRFSITRQGDSVKMLFVPELSAKPDGENAQTDAIRAALSVPLVFNKMTIEEIDAEMENRLNGYCEARQSASSAYDEMLLAMNDATAGAKNTKAKTDKTPPVKAKAKPADKPQTAVKAKSAEATTGVLDF